MHHSTNRVMHFFWDIQHDIFLHILLKNQSVLGKQLRINTTSPNHIGKCSKEIQSGVITPKLI